MSVGFGSSLSQTEMLHPLGSRETSPYGADAYTLTNAGAGAVKYESVIFEFTHDHGMQMVLARFAPGSADLLLEELHKTLGTPNSSNESATPEQSEASWDTAGGVRVNFIGPRRRLIMLGPYGKSLQSDIELRDQIGDY